MPEEGLARDEAILRALLLCVASHSLPRQVAAALDDILKMQRRGSLRHVGLACLTLHMARTSESKVKTFLFFFPLSTLEAS